MAATTSFGASAFRGTAWNYATYVLSKAAVAVTTVVLARLLLPEDFGLMALGLLFVNYLDGIRDLGVGPAVIYRQEDPDRTSDVAFVLSMAFTSFLAVGAFFAAPAAADFFGEPRVVAVIRALSVALLLSGLGSIHESRLRKQLDFRRRLAPELARAVSKGAVAILLAVLGFGVWSLVWGQLASALVATAIYWRISGWRPGFTWDPAIAKRLVRYGLPMAGVSLGALLHDNIDYLVVGRRLGAAELGFYTLGFRIPELVVISSCVVISQVLFPAYARLQHDREAMQRGYLGALRAVTLFTVPAGIGLALVAPEAVTVLYSERWSATVPVMQLLALHAALYSLSFHAGDVYKAIGRPNILNALTVGKLALSVPVLWIAAGYSIVHVAAAMVALTAVLTSVRLTVAAHVLGMPSRSFLTAVRPAVLAGGFMAAGLLALRSLTDLAAPWRLGLLVLAGACLYLLGLRLFDPDVLRELRSVLARLRSAGPPGPAAAADHGHGQRHLAFLVPARPGDRVGAVGASPALLSELAATGADVYVEEPAGPAPPPGSGGAGAGFGLPFASATLDSLVVPEVRTDPRTLVAEARRTLRPGGELVIGVGNAHAVQRLRPARRNGRTGSPSLLSAGASRRLLERGGFEDVGVYGALESLATPRFLVSLDAASTGRYFFHSVFEPHSRAAALTLRALPLMDGLQLHRVLFPGLVLSARRATTGGDERA